MSHALGSTKFARAILSELPPSKLPIGGERIRIVVAVDPDGFLACCGGEPVGAIRLTRQRLAGLPPLWGPGFHLVESTHSADRGAPLQWLSGGGTLAHHRGRDDGADSRQLQWLRRGGGGRGR